MFNSPVRVKWRKLSFNPFSEMYVKEVESGMCDGQVSPIVVQETPATAFVDGRSGMGPVSLCLGFAGCIYDV